MKTKVIIIASALVLMAVSTVLAGAEPPLSSIPTLGQWGMIGAAVALGAAGLYTIFKRK